MSSTTLYLNVYNIINFNSCGFIIGPICIYYDDINFSSKGAENFSLKARIIMRNYSNCSSLPLIPGRYGPVIIVGFNLILTFIAVFFTSTLI